MCRYLHAHCRAKMCVVLHKAKIPSGFPSEQIGLLMSLGTRNIWTEFLYLFKLLLNIFRAYSLPLDLIFRLLFSCVYTRRGEYTDYSILTEVLSAKPKSPLGKFISQQWLKIIYEILKGNISSE